FFQAEDGIRDDLVTGVQTCALPISTSIAKAATGSTIRNTAGMHLTGTGKRRISSGVRALVAQAALVVPAVRVALVVSEDPAEPRSEERRVGKECRCRGGAWDERSRT